MGRAGQPKLPKVTQVDAYVHNVSATNSDEMHFAEYSVVIRPPCVPRRVAKLSADVDSATDVSITAGRVFFTGRNAADYTADSFRSDSFWECPTASSCRGILCGSCPALSANSSHSGLLRPISAIHRCDRKQHQAAPLRSTLRSSRSCRLWLRRC